MTRPCIYIHRLMYLGYDEYMDAQNERLLAAFADVVNDAFLEQSPSPAEMAERLRGVTGILSLNGSGACDITTEALEAAGTVQVAVISHWWHGSHDQAAAMWRAAGVAVIDESDACNEAVAEWTIGAAIAGLRRFEQYDRELKSGTEWPSWRRASQLNGSTFGIVSLGRVGRLVARYLSVFDCRIIAYDPYIDPEVAEQLGVELVDLDTLLSTADVISLHTPVLPETTGMLGARELALIKDGAVLVNSARAALYDGKAFRAELAKGRFTAYLDVFDPEPPPLDDVLRTLSNVVLTPHVAGATPLMYRRCGRRAIERLRAWFSEIR
ncbi:MAG: hydroxyacid dehydrogenase [Candidatus Zipacnadales bacterium]